MLFRNTVLAAVCAALALPALAQAPAATPSDRLVARYAPLAGSESNARALVNGLRDGSEVTLKSGTRVATFDPPTQKMGYGNIDNALAIAEASLQKQGIEQPTPEQLKASLMDVLQRRADGKGWGQIANSQGFRLGELKRAERTERAERPQRPERPEKPEKPERPEKPQRPERPEHPRR